MCTKFKMNKRRLLQISLLMHPRKQKRDEGIDGTGQGQPESSVLSVDETNKFGATFISDPPIAESSSSVRSDGNGIKTPLRSTMTEERLNALILLFVHKDILINI